MPDSPADVERLQYVLARLEADECPTWESPARQSLLDLASGPLGYLITSSCRVMPRQARAVVSVERLLAAAERIVRQRRRIDVLSIETVAAQAGVTPQAAYRYFADIHELITLAVRRILVVEHERLLDFISAQAFETETELAIAAVAFIIRAFRMLERAPPSLSHTLLKGYFDVCYDACWILSDLLQDRLARQGGPCARLGMVELAAGLTATTAMARLFALKDAALLGQPGAQRTMLASFIGALQPPSANGETKPQAARPLEGPKPPCYARGSSQWSPPR